MTVTRFNYRDKWDFHTWSAKQRADYVYDVEGLLCEEDVVEDFIYWYHDETIARQQIAVIKETPEYKARIGTSASALLG